VHDLSQPPDLSTGLFVFVLATLLGLEVIRRVSPLLHTPLMSLTNAISAIAIVVAIELAGNGTWIGGILGGIAVIAAAINIVGGFLITDRMLKMFRRREPQNKN
jgi:NAD(P) transhydrogenase subunit alpha